VGRGFSLGREGVSRAYREGEMAFLTLLIFSERGGGKHTLVREIS